MTLYLAFEIKPLMLLDYQNKPCHVNVLCKSLVILTLEISKFDLNITYEVTYIVTSIRRSVILYM